MKKLTIVCLILVLSLMATLTSGVSAQDMGMVRFVHAIVGGAEVDVAVDGQVVASAIAYGSASDYISVALGDHQVQVFEAGTQTLLWEQSVTSTVDPISMIASSATAPMFVEFIENVDPLSLGQARITAIHAVEGAPNVDVVLVDGRPVITDLAYATSYGTLDVPVFNYALNVIPTGESLATALFPVEFEAALATGTSYSIVVYGALEQPEYMILATPVKTGANEGTLRLTNSFDKVVDVYANDALVAASLMAGGSTEAFPLVAGDYQVQFVVANTIENLGGENATVVANQTSVATLASDGTVSLTAETTTTTTVASLPTPTPAVVEAVAVAVPAPTATPSLGLVQPTALPPQPTQPETLGRITAQVLIDAGANLQLRQYPSSESLSLGLAPANAILDVVGRVGVPVQLTGLYDPKLQEEIDNYVDPIGELVEDADLVAADTWLNVDYTTADGGKINAWVSAQYLVVTNELGEIQRLADLPPVPSNVYGEVINTVVTPPSEAELSGVSGRVINLDPGINLHIRRTPSGQGESIGLLSNGTVVEFIGFIVPAGTNVDLETLTEEEVQALVDQANLAPWIYVRYTTPQGAVVSGWVAYQYVDLYWEGVFINAYKMQEEELLSFVEDTEIGEMGAGAIAPIVPTLDPLRDAYIAEVVLDPGANLQFRRTPSIYGESLGLLSSGTQMVALGRTVDEQWIQIDYQGQTGWVSSTFIRIRRNNASASITELEILDVALEPTPAS
ncbi:MAG: DUF4397 domain-containing protein [Phototrophicaceae bacterium]